MKHFLHFESLLLAKHLEIILINTFKIPLFLIKLWSPEVTVVFKQILIVDKQFEKQKFFSTFLIDFKIYS